MWVLNSKKQIIKEIANCKLRNVCEAVCSVTPGLWIPVC